jgi:hypothetical protein
MNPNRFSSASPCHGGNFWPAAGVADQVDVPDYQAGDQRVETWLLLDRHAFER